MEHPKNLEFTPIWGLTWPDDFNLDPATVENIEHLDPITFLAEIFKADDNPEYTPIPHTHLTHALMLFARCADSTQYDGVDPISLFAGCCDTVLIWSFG